MKLTVSQKTLVNNRSIVSVTFSLLISLCLLSTLLVDTAFAQPQTNKIAIIFRELHVFNAHGDCANWILWASVYYGSAPRGEYDRSITQNIAEGCFHSGGNYPLRFPTTAIVDEYPPNEWRGLWLHGYNKGWFGWDRLAERIECCLRIPSVVEYRTAVATQPPYDMFRGNVDYIVDYSVSYQYINCRNPIWFLILDSAINGLCRLPPGQYYQYPGDMTWTRGVAPPLDLEGSP
jgi:hypothetical protein